MQAWVGAEAHAQQCVSEGSSVCGDGREKTTLVVKFFRPQKLTLRAFKQHNEDSPMNIASSAFVQLESGRRCEVRPTLPDAPMLSRITAHAS